MVTATTNCCADMRSATGIVGAMSPVPVETDRFAAVRFGTSSAALG